MFKINIFSRHPSHRVLRKYLKKLPIRSLLRLGSLSSINDGKNRIELNSIESIKNSSNKRLMKEKFNEADVPTAYWINASTINELIDYIEDEEDQLKYPIVAKSLYGSQGVGNSLIKTFEELNNWSNNKDYNNYIFENYVSYLLEYRLHITKNGCFYACRKALKADTPEKEKWRRHKDNSVWLLEENENFLKPNSWDDIINSCVKALNAIGADILSFDCKVQSAKNKEGEQREYQEYILLECNSASSMQTLDENKEISICASKYLEIIPKLILEKRENKNVKI